MLTVVYVLCGVTGAFLVLNAVLVITLHRLNNKLAKKPPLVTDDAPFVTDDAPFVTPSAVEGSQNQSDEEN